MIDVLGADVIIAGTQTEAERRQGDARERFAALEPIARYAVFHKWTDEKMATVIRKAPGFARVAEAFREEETYHGQSIWTPVLGNRRGHFLHQLRSYALVLALLRDHEAARRAQYTRVVFSRLELVWLAPHPPLHLLSPSLLWVPVGAPRMNDRHVVMNRSQAEIWLGRWSPSHPEP